MTEGAPNRVAAQRIQLMAHLRGCGATLTGLSRNFATWLGLHHTDAAALLDIVEAEQRGRALSPARLSASIGLTSGATTAVINRLETAQHVVRARESDDRRVVTLRASTGVGALAEAYFGPLGHRLDELMAGYSAEQLDLIESFLSGLHATLNRHLQESVPPPKS